MGAECTSCEDDIIAPMSEGTGSDSSNVLLDAIVAADPPTDTDSDTDADTDSDLPVASRTRSSGA